METITEAEFLTEISTNATMSDTNAKKMTDSQTETDLVENQPSNNGSQQEDQSTTPEDSVVLRRNKSEKSEPEDILTNGNDPFLGELTVVYVCV